MKVINYVAWYKVNNKIILMVGDRYGGTPLIMCTYDVLICSKEIFDRFSDALIAEHLRKKGWSPSVRYI